MLCTDCFKKLTYHFKTPNIDLYASRLNYQISLYISWRPGPNAIGVDEFQRSWGSNYNYIYPAFSLIGMVLKKDSGGWSGGGSASGTLMDNVTLVPKIAGTSSGLTRLTLSNYMI